MKIAVLALHGAFAEHRRMLHSLSAETIEIRNADDWQQHKDALIIPGGESTVMTKLLRQLNLEQPIRQAILQGMPVFGTCAGLILLARQEDGKPTQRLATMNIDVCRNAYGRQLGSFHTQAACNGIDHPVPMTFIRAPYIRRTYETAQPLATVDGHIVAARQYNQLVTAFHPELDNDTALHRYFLEMVRTSTWEQ